MCVEGVLHLWSALQFCSDKRGTKNVEVWMISSLGQQSIVSPHQQSFIPKIVSHLYI